VLGMVEVAQVQYFMVNDSHPCFIQ
jgi:hypothetical protein